MKTRMLSGVIFGLTLCLATAQEGERQRDQDRRGERQRGPDRMERQRDGGAPGVEGARFVVPLLEALDRNKDGTIDSEEMDRAKESLRTLDKNDDRKITPDEYRFQRPPGMGGPMAGGGFGGGQQPNMRPGPWGRGFGAGDSRMRGPAGPERPEGLPGGPRQPGNRRFGPGNVGEFPVMQTPPGFHLMPPPLQERLRLSDKQKEKLDDLEEATKKKMEKILTEEQREQLKRMGR